MRQALSERAQRYIQTWERRPYVENLGLVGAAIKEVGLPVTDPVLDFHRTFAAYMTGEGVGSLFRGYRTKTPDPFYSSKETTHGIERKDNRQY